MFKTLRRKADELIQAVNENTSELHSIKAHLRIPPPPPAPIVIELDAVKHELAQLHNQLAGLHHSVNALVQIEAKRERHEIAQRGY